MKRSIDPDFEFDKARFSEILKQATGARSNVEFARDAELSVSYLSRYINQKVDTAPTLGTLKKIANAAKGVSYAELLEASGYDVSKYDADEMDFATGNAEWSPMNALLPALSKATYNWKFVDPIGVNGGPISVKADGSPFDMWYFIPVTKESVAKEDIIAVLGSKAAEVMSPESKVTFLTASKEVFDQMSAMELNLISLRISVAYIYSKNCSVSDEMYVKTAVTLTDLDQEYMLTNIEDEVVGPLSL